ncbi:hypothetical protein HDU97_001333 [Phlyctochytrium planicorne]|nr:hypothetical protein HDU97_001333 [Phlyctochytrium planicorne]
MRISVIVIAITSLLGVSAAIDPIIDAEDRGLWDAAAIVNAAATGSIGDRVKAANAWGRIQLPQTIDPLIKLLGDRDSAVVSAAAFALGQLSYDPSFNGGRKDEIVAALNSTLYTRGLDAEKGSRTAPAILISIGKLAGPLTGSIVSPFLSAKESDTKEQALFAMFRCRLAGPQPAESDATIAALNSLVNDNSVRVRRALGFAISRLRDARVRDLAIKLSTDADEFVRYPALIALRVSGPPLVSNLILSLKDSSERVRVAAINQLRVAVPANVSTTETIRDVAASDESFHVRNVLATYLNKDAPGRLWDNLLRKDASPTVRASAVTNYANVFGDAAIPVILQLAKDPVYQVRAAAVGAAVNFPSIADNVVQEALKDSNIQVVFAAFEAFAGAPFENDWILSAIQYHISSPHIFVRSSAIDALSVLTPAPSVDAVYDLYVKSLDGPSKRSFKDIRQQIVDFLITLPVTEASTAALVKVLDDPYAQVRNDAIAELVKRNVTVPSLPDTDPLEFTPYRDNATFDVKENPKVKFVTTKGDMVFEMYAKDAPIHVASFLGLVKDGVYNGLTWHRVVDNFVIQGGDPDGGGYGDAGFNLRAEINNRVYDRGAIGMPRSTAFASGGCQIFISHVPTPNLDGQYTVFGKVVEGLSVIDKIEVGDGIVSATIL